MTAVQHRDEFLDPFGKLYAAAIDYSFVLMNNNTWPQRAAIIDDFLESNGLQLWSGQDTRRPLNQLNVFGMPWLCVDVYHLQPYWTLRWFITS